MIYRSIALTLSYLLSILPIPSFASAPEDIQANQRVWFDAADINADGNYENNPANNTRINTWFDKSSFAHHVNKHSAHDGPLYLASSNNNLPTLYFDNETNPNDVGLHRLSTIYNGVVGEVEIFHVLTNDKIRPSFSLASHVSQSIRISTHLSWSDERIYWDHGTCCGSNSRASTAAYPFILNQTYIAHLTSSNSDNNQQIIIDGEVITSKNHSSTFNSTTSTFTLAGFYIDNSSVYRSHSGYFFEILIYQERLKDAYRTILQNYLSSKWSKDLHNQSTFSDIYQGDTATNGHHDFFMGAIGIEADGAQSTASSQGLTLTDIDFLSGTGKYIAAAVPYLNQASQYKTMVTTDIPKAEVHSRTKRTWYIDSTGSGGQITLKFDAATIGLPVTNGDKYQLLYKSNASGNFSVIDTVIMSGGTVSFTRLPTDGIYAIGIPARVSYVKKTMRTVWDPINLYNNPKSIPGALIDYSIIVTYHSDQSITNNSVVLKDIIADNLDLFVGNYSNGSPIAFNDATCAGTSNPASSNLSFSTSDVTYKNSSHTVITPIPPYDTTVREITIPLAGQLNNTTQVGGNTPCFTIKFRTQLK